MIAEYVSKKLEDKKQESQNNAADDDKIWSYYIYLILGETSEDKASQGKNHRKKRIHLLQIQQPVRNLP